MLEMEFDIRRRHCLANVWQVCAGDDLSGYVVCGIGGMTSCRVCREAWRSCMSTAICQNVIRVLVQCGTMSSAI